MIWKSGSIINESGSMVEESGFSFSKSAFIMNESGFFSTRCGCFIAHSRFVTRGGRFRSTHSGGESRTSRSLS
jgi:hypothetical protein